MNGSGVLKRVWHWVRWPLLVLVVLYVGFAIWGATLVFERDKTEAAVAAIHAQKLSMADVRGDNLPPPPDKAENDATVAGIDKNNNGIRDDVELAIFKAYPNSAKLRAGQLQYAMAQQMYLTEVFNQETWAQVAEENDRAFFCIMELHPTQDFASYSFAKNYTSKIEEQIFNTQERKNLREKAFSFTTGYGSTDKASCDVELESLQN